MRVRRMAAMGVLVVVMAACQGPGSDTPAVTSPTPVGEVAADCAALADEPTVDGPVSDDADVARAQRQRAAKGLASDAATVRQIMAEVDEDQGWYPFPHTRAEREQLRSRQPSVAEVSDLRQWAHTEAGDVFAGLWIDQAAGAVVTVAVTGDVEASRDRFHQRFSGELVVVEADHSYAELAALADRISADRRADRDQRSDRQRRYPEPGTIHSVNVHEPVNRVRVGVTDGNRAPLAELSARYGPDRLCLHRHPPTEPPDDDGPVVPLVKAHGWRESLDRDWSALVEIAYDRATAATAWADNVPDDLPVADRDDAEPGVYASLADVDFAQQAVVVWSAGESGSCPQWLGDIRTDDGGGTIHLNRDTAGGPVCTEDYTPYRMLVAVDRDRLPHPDRLPTDDVDGVADTRVTTYPAARR